MAKHKIDPESEPWIPCDQGILAELPMRKISRRQLFVAGGAAVTIGVGLVVRNLMAEDSVPTETYIVLCEDCVELLPRYIAGTLDSPPLRLSIAKHLSSCCSCRRKYDRMV